MNRDDSDLTSLSDEDDYQGDNGSEMDNDDEGQDLKMKNDEPPSKTICIPHQAAHTNEARHMPENGWG
ncbi:hypothetical protein TNCV_3611631 [Trichonephila clavipes]|nr:hypothetical protein TNCV_3611631 [Trichonephila clavipes]